MKEDGRPPSLFRHAAHACLPFAIQIDVLKDVNAPMSIYREFALEYYRQGKIDEMFVMDHSIVAAGASSVLSSERFM